MNVSDSFISQLYHFVAFKLKNSKMQLENGMFVISIDIDVGDKLLGVINEGKNDRNVNKYFSEYAIGKIEETVFPLFLDLFNEHEVPVTFAIRGQLVNVNPSIFELLLDSSVDYDIGAHGYSHKPFTSMSRDGADEELTKISRGTKKIGISPKSFVFPRNSVAHLDLLEKHGYKCFRSYGDFRSDCMWIEKKEALYDIHPSLYLDLCIDSSLLKRILDIAISKKLPFHIWLHLWNFGRTKKLTQRSITKVFVPLLEYAKKKENEAVLNIETMYSATKKVEEAVEFQ